MEARCRSGRRGRHGDQVETPLSREVVLFGPDKLFPSESIICPVICTPTLWRKAVVLDKVIITTGRTASRRADGIAIVPAALLGP
jgi:hypothetical protein